MRDCGVVRKGIFFSLTINEARKVGAKQGLISFLIVIGKVRIQIKQ